MHLYERLGTFKMDVLKEVGNIGAGNAATALSRLLNRTIDMKVPQARLMPFDCIADEVGGPDQVVITIYFRVEGDSPGHLFFMFAPEAAKVLLSYLATVPLEEGEGFSDLELSALAEIGNILAGSYLSSLADFTRMTMSPTVPQVAIDMAGAVLNYGILQYGEMGDSALLIDTKFLEGCDEVQGTFFLIPDPDSFSKIFAALGVPLHD
ncbi:chemotaxis protein [Paenibacillus popilliae ATCC 14706]|uniref:Chemotaxis protein n=2 Tax=Paenibacillus popilliae TaxID=78057 RepID=M9LQI9_PAEPP|nr:chemotaxis protein [Paenibacillus popilliae ATCC 14706]